MCTLKMLKTPTAATLMPLVSESRAVAKLAHFGRITKQRPELMIFFNGNESKKSTLQPVAQFDGPFALETGAGDFAFAPGQRIPLEAAHRFQSDTRNTAHRVRDEGLAGSNPHCDQHSAEIKSTLRPALS
jgi:hypothetical protein